MFCFDWKIETNPRAPKIKVNDKVRVTKYKNKYKKNVTLKIVWVKYSLLIQFWKLIFAIIELKF